MKTTMFSGKNLGLIIITSVLSITATTGYSAYKEINSGGDVIQASVNADSNLKTSYSNERINIRAPLTSSKLWSDVIESTRYQVIENASSQTQILEENAKLKTEVADLQARVNQIESSLAALEIRTMPGETMLTRKFK